MPRVYIIPTATPNAFATGRNSNHAAVAAAITYIAYFPMWFGVGRNRDGNPIVGLLMLILAPLPATIIQAAMSRSPTAERVARLVRG